MPPMNSRTGGIGPQGSIPGQYTGKLPALSETAIVRPYRVEREHLHGRIQQVIRPIDDAIWAG